MWLPMMCISYNITRQTNKKGKHPTSRNVNTECPLLNIYCLYWPQKIHKPENSQVSHQVTSWLEKFFVPPTKQLQNTANLLSPLYGLSLFSVRVFHMYDKDKNDANITRILYLVLCKSSQVYFVILGLGESTNFFASKIAAEFEPANRDPRLIHYWFEKKARCLQCGERGW